MAGQPHGADRDVPLTRACWALTHHVTVTALLSACRVVNKWR